MAKTLAYWWVIWRFLCKSLHREVNPDCHAESHMITIWNSPRIELASPALLSLFGSLWACYIEALANGDTLSGTRRISGGRWCRSRSNLWSCERGSLLAGVFKYL